MALESLYDRFPSTVIAVAPVPLVAGPVEILHAKLLSDMPIFRRDLHSLLEIAFGFRIVVEQIDFGHKKGSN